MGMSKASELRELLRQDGIITAPGAYDCITARMVEQAGFRKVESWIVDRQKQTPAFETILAIGSRLE